MRIIVYDIEVFAYDWIVVFYDTSNDEWSVFHNDNQGVRDYMSQQGVIFCGFNNKHYDNHIVKAISCGASPELVKQINDFIIEEKRSGWEHYFLKQNRFWFDSFDIMDDSQEGTSLKHIEAHLSWNIEETQVDFSIDRPLTKEELDSTIFYCKWDVKATAYLLTLRKNYLNAKLDVGRSIGISDAKSLNMTNARLTATALKAEYVERNDGRDYVYPDNLKKEYIPKEVLDFFDRLHDPSIPDDELFSSKLKIMVDGAEAVIGFGGIHHARNNYSEESTGNRVIRNFDVASLYPSLMVNNCYISRNIPSSEIFENFYHTRLNAKKSGDKKTANTLKLILNTTYGASLAKTNPLYDQKQGVSVCLTGQMYLLELAQRYLAECKTVKILQINTDGIMISIEEHEMEIIYRINDEWMAERSLELEEDKIRYVAQKDVNNYVMVFEDGKVKTKGAYVTYGMATAGAFKINNDFTIVKEAVIKYFTEKIPVEETINGCNDIFKFQIIAKAGGGYKSCYRIPPDFEARKKAWSKENRVRRMNNQGKEVWYNPPMKWDNYDGPRCEVQRVNRVYASIKPGMGTIVKVKPDGTIGKIGGLPDNCIIDNKNKLTIHEVDKTWYINLAKKYIEDYGVCV